MIIVGGGRRPFCSGLKHPPAPALPRPTHRGRGGVTPKVRRRRKAAQCVRRADDLGSPAIRCSTVATDTTCEDTGTRYGGRTPLRRRDVTNNGYRAPAAHRANAAPRPVARASLRALSAAATGIVGSSRRRRRRRQPVEYNGRVGEHQAGVRVGVIFFHL